MKKFNTLFVTVLAMLVFAPSAFASNGQPDNGWIAIASALAISVSAFAGALAQGRAVTAALDSIGRNPGAAGKITTPMIIGLALIESLVIYALVIAIILSGKVA